MSCNEVHSAARGEPAFAALRIETLPAQAEEIFVEVRMGYLLPSEYVAYGLTADTQDSWVTAASAMIEAYCKRPTLMAASYTEYLRVSRHTQRVRLSYGPLISVDDVQARYARPSRLFLEEQPFAVEFAEVFGLPGTWATVDPTTLEVGVPLGEFRFPWNVMGLRHAEAEVTYTAGLTTIPDAVKVACAQIVKNAQATPGLNVKSSKLDTLQTQYFSDSLLDTQVKAMLRPFVAERMA
jgi:hypothetical protein